MPSFALSLLADTGPLQQSCLRGHMNGRKQGRSRTPWRRFSSGTSPEDPTTHESTCQGDKGRSSPREAIIDKPASREHPGRKAPRWRPPQVKGSGRRCRPNTDRPWTLIEGPNQGCQRYEPPRTPQWARFESGWTTNERPSQGPGTLRPARHPGVPSSHSDNGQLSGGHSTPTNRSSCAAAHRQERHPSAFTVYICSKPDQRSAVSPQLYVTKG